MVTESECSEAWRGFSWTRQAVEREIGQRYIPEGDSRKQGGWHVKEGGRRLVW